MRPAAADLDFEEAARLRDEIKRLRATELAVVDDPTAKRPALPAPRRGTRVHKPALDEMGIATWHEVKPDRDGKAPRKPPRNPRFDAMRPGVESIPARGRAALGRP